MDRGRSRFSKLAASDIQCPKNNPCGNRGVREMELIKINAIIPFDIEESWKKVFASLPKATILYPSELNDEEVRVRLSLLSGNFNAAMHWVYKKRWNPKHKIPGPRSLVKSSEPLGNFLLSRLNLCAEVHLLKHPLSRGYESAADWFDVVACEFRDELIKEHLGCTNNKGKLSLIKSLRNELAILKAEENPYKPDTKHWELIQACLEIIKSGIAPNFYKVFWRGKRGKNFPPGFISSFSAYIASIESPQMKELIFKDGEFYLRSGRGSGLNKYPLLRAFKKQ
jgi:hypothetical protein